MQAGFRASAFGRRGRHLRFVTIVSALALINVWLWSRLVLGVVAGQSNLTGDMLIAVVAATASLLAVFALWRNPLRRSVSAQSTPARRHALATHHSGHIVALHLLDPTRITRTSLSGPCVFSPATDPAMSQTALRNELSITLSGLTAEEVFAGESGSHTAADLTLATSIGADMVGRFGMAGSLVSLATAERRRGKFITRVLDDARTRKELEALLRDTKRDSMRIMLENRHLIIAVRDALLRIDALDSAEIRRIISDTEQRRNIDDEVLVDLRSVSERGRPLMSASEL